MARGLTETNDWRKQAVAHEIRTGFPWSAFIECSNENPATFDPKIAGERQDNYDERRKAASVICARCPVIEQCLGEAYKLKDFDTFRGGLTGEERRVAAKQRQGATVRRLLANKT